MRGEASRTGGHGSRPAPPRAFPSAWPCSRWGLPGRAGQPARRWSLTPPFHPYGHGGCPWFAVCLCGPVRGSPRPGVTRHRTLWSPDFPRPCSRCCRAATTRPTQASNVCHSPMVPRSGLTSMAGRAIAFGTGTSECDTHSEPLRGFLQPRKVRKPCGGKRRGAARSGGRVADAMALNRCARR